MPVRIVAWNLVFQIIFLLALLWSSAVSEVRAAYYPSSPDPCVVGSKSLARISQTANTQIITGVSGKQTYICGVNLVTAAANNVNIVEGTGTTCGTSTIGVSSGGATAATGWNLGANGGIAQGGGLGTLMQTTTSGGGANVCLFQSAATQTTGVISYVQQ